MRTMERPKECFFEADGLDWEGNPVCSKVVLMTEDPIQALPWDSGRLISVKTSKNPCHTFR